MPQWNVVEELLSEDITRKTEETKKNMMAGVEKLHELLNGNAIMAYLDEHLRFPNMKVALITLDNAQSSEERENIRKYMG